MNRFALIAAALLSSIAFGQTPADKDLGTGKVIGLDYYYNHQVRNGKQFHYIWDDSDRNSGFSKFGDVWKQYGATLGKLEKAPTAADLKKFSIYIICNPNNQVKAADHKPNYIEPADVDAIVSWVNDGGVLAIFANDEKNGGCEFVHLNTLSQRFGITFNNVLRNEVPSAKDRTPGTFGADQFPDHPLFAGVKMIYMKEICTITTADPATPLLEVRKEAAEGDGKDTIAATCRYGKGMVFAVCDPWFYNEYIDLKGGPNLPINNRLAAENFVKWILPLSAKPAQ